MNQNRKEYQPLLGSWHRLFRFSLVSIHELWLANDHLLSLNRTSIYENYQRFYFQDIQSVIFKKTKMQLIKNIVLTLLCLLMSYISYDNHFGPISLSITTIFILITIWNYFKGSSCKVYLVTAVQNKELPMLKLVKQANRFIKIIQPLIEREQGSIEDLSDTIPETVNLERKQKLKLPKKELNKKELPIKANKHRYFLYSFWFLLGIFELVLSMKYMPSLFFISLSFLLIIFAINIFALTQLKAKGTHLLSKVCAWFGISYLTLKAILLMILFETYSIQQELGYTEHGFVLDSLKSFVGTEAYKMTLGGLSILSIILSICGFIGLFLKKEPQQEQKQT